MQALLTFCKTIGKLFQSKDMFENKSFLIRNVTAKDLKVLEGYIKDNNLDCTASFNPNDVHPVRMDKNGKPYPPSIFVNYDSVDVSNWV